MATIQSAGELVTVETDAYRVARRATPGLALYGHRASYATLVRTQPNVRTVISFVARNIAQLGVGIFERIAEDDRRRIRDHQFAEALRQPNPGDRRLTTYRLIHRTVWDVCAFDAAFWALLDVPGGALARPVIVPLQPERMEIRGTLWPTSYIYHGPRGSRELDPARVVHFQGSTDLDDPLWGVPPIETLRRVLAEEAAAGEYREQFWRSGARISGVIHRPATAPKWSDGARDRFKSDWQGLYSGQGPAAGGTPILEDGMEWQEAGTADARSSQYIEARKLTREECAAAWHIDPIWVGVDSGGQAFASVRERHKALYQDALGPWVTMLDQDLTVQALPAFEEDPDRRARIYVKLNVAEKLRGSVEEQAEAITKLTGRPVLTVNEARALLERNAIPAGEGLTVPLNVIIGGQVSPGADPVDAAGELAATPAAKAIGPSRAKDGLTEAQRQALATEHRTAALNALVRTFERQRAEVLAELGAGGTSLEEVFDRARWDDELAADLLGLAVELAGVTAEATAEALGFDDVDTEILLPWLAENSRIAAENINYTTGDQLTAALEDEEADTGDAVRNVFAIAATSRAAQIAQTRFTSVHGFAAQDAARQAGRGEKTWVVTSTDSRHPELDGETVPLGSRFSNGADFPGDPAAGVAQSAGCRCAMVFT